MLCKVMYQPSCVYCQCHLVCSIELEDYIIYKSLTCDSLTAGNTAADKSVKSTEQNTDSADVCVSSIFSTVLYPPTPQKYLNI